MQVCTYMQVCKYTSVQVCKYASMQLCKYASMHVYASMQVCTYMQVCKYAHIPKSAFVTSRQKQFTYALGDYARLATFFLLICFSEVNSYQWISL